MKQDNKKEKIGEIQIKKKTKQNKQNTRDQNR